MAKDKEVEWRRIYQIFISFRKDSKGLEKKTRRFKKFVIKV